MDYSTTFFEDADIFTGLGLVFLVIMLVFLALLIVYIIGLWKVYEKAGKPGWACIVPFYGNYVLVEIAGLHWIYFVLLIANDIVDILGLYDLAWVASIISLYASFMCAYNIAKRFNKGTGYAICLFLFGIILYPILGFSKKEKYDSSIPVSEHGVFGVNDKSTVNQNDAVSQDYYYENQNNDNTKHVYCTTCGTKVNKDIRFCPNCGTEIIK